MKRILIAATAMLLLFCSSSCQNKTKEKKQADPEVVQVNRDDYNGEPIAKLDPRLQTADSLIFVFYKDPHGPDSLRYTRYYKQQESRSPEHISILLESLKNKTERFEKVKPCRSEGKIWCFSKGNIFQTIYFSASPEACRFVYIIRHGMFFYSPLGPELENMLQSQALLAREPENAGMQE